MRRSDQSSVALNTLSRRTLAEDVLESLVEFVAAGEEPLQRLPPEQVLSERLGVGRGAVREALAALGHLGIVETRGKARVASTVAARAYLLRRELRAERPPESVAHAMEARALLEPPMARLAAERATPQDLETIQGFLRGMEAAPDAADLIIEYDAGFHVAIARATGNPTLVHMVSAIADALAATRRISLNARSGPETSIAGHHAIVDALTKPDPALAEAAMRQHLDDVARLITHSGARSP